MNNLRIYLGILVWIPTVVLWILFVPMFRIMCLMLHEKHRPTFWHMMGVQLIYKEKK